MIKFINLKSIENGVLGKTNAQTKNSDVSITFYWSEEKGNMIRMLFHYPTFKKFRFVKLSRVDSALFFILSNTNFDNKSYAISQKNNSRYTQIKGKNAIKLKEFSGNYILHQYDYENTLSSPIYYIELEERQ